jgi:uncharacterized membrane protein YsdA (DUF1294 family)
MLLLFAAASFACLSPTHHDGDNIRCRNIDGSMRLHGIDAPEMPGACRPGRMCTPGDPYAARDHLRELTRGRSVTCEQVDTDRYGRRVVACEAEGVDLACAMIADGFAVPRYGDPGCRPQRSARLAAPVPPAAASPPPPPVEAAPPAPAPVPAPAPPPPPARAAPAGALVLAERVLLAWLALINLAGFAVMAADKRRARRLARRIPESRLLLLALAGGSAGVLAGQEWLGHKTRKAGFSRRLWLIIAVQVAAIWSLFVWLA